MELRLCDPCRRVVAAGTRCPACGGAVTLAEPERLLGDSFGKYTLEAVIGAGGMGIVYRAVHRTLERPVALKLLLPHGDDEDDQFRRRFEREARVLAEVKHPNVVEVYDFDVDQWGVPYVVMEYLSGTTLRALIRRRGALPWRELQPVVADVAAGLASVHRRGVVHRDLKPENIFLAEFDRRTVAKVLDFGIAKATAGDRQETRLTRSGLVVGTLNYLSPEQLLGDPVGPASDQYALALVVVEALTGRCVRSGKTMGRIVSDEIRQPVELAAITEPGVAPALADVIRRATAPRPEARFTDIEAFARALDAAHEADDAAPPTVRQQVSGLEPATVVSRTTTDSAPRDARQRWWLPAIGAALVLAALLLGLWAVVQHGLGSRPARESAGERQPALTVTREIPLPLDAGRLIAWNRGLLTTTGTDGLIVSAPDADREPDRIGIRPADVLAATPDGELVLRQGTAAVVHRLAGNESMPWADGLPPVEQLTASPDCRYLVTQTATGLAVYGVGEGTHFTRLREHELGAPPHGLVVGNRILAAVTGDRLLAWRLADGFVLADRPLDGGRVEHLAVHDDAGLIAFGGWSDQVSVVDLASGRETSIARRPGADRSLAIAFLHAGPTLVVGERGGVTLWRPDDGIVGRWDREGGEIVDLLTGGGWIAALDRVNRAAVILTVTGPAAAHRLRVADGAAWALAVDSVSSRLLVGGADGTLSSVALDSGEIVPHAVHTLGITSLAASGDRLATASDDRTIAIWRLPDLIVEWRSRAHEFLVNQLRLDTAAQALWSTSSDGALKRWTWPELELEESIDTAAVLGTRYALHAVWVAPDGQRAVVGTWNRAVLWLERTPAGDWQGRALPFAAYGGYAIVALPAVEVLVLAGILHPYAVAAIDLRTGALLRLPGAGHAVRALVPTTSGRGALGFADAEVLTFELARTADGGLECTLAAVSWPEMEIASAALALPDGRIAVATDAGEVLVIDPADLARPVLGTFTLEPAPG